MRLTGALIDGQVHTPNHRDRPKNCALLIRRRQGNRRARRGFRREVRIDARGRERMRTGRLLDRAECGERLPQLRFQRFTAAPCLSDGALLLPGDTLRVFEDLASLQAKLLIGLSACSLSRGGMGFRMAARVTFLAELPLHLAVRLFLRGGMRFGTAT